jgi:hypothetical protein
MNTRSHKKRSSGTLALWLICAAMILSVIGTPAYDAPKGASSVNTKVPAHRVMIPSLFPNEILAFDPEKILIDDQDRDATYLFYPIIEKAASRYKVDSAMVRAIILAESSYNPYAISRKGAKGLMQLMPITAKELGVKDSFNPVQNIYAGVRYFKNLLERYNGDVKLALAAYNAGSQVVLRYRGVPPFKDTRFYIKKVLEYHQHYSQPAIPDASVQAGASKS